MINFNFDIIFNEYMHMSEADGLYYAHIILELEKQFCHICNNSRLLFLFKIHINTVSDSFGDQIDKHNFACKYSWNAVQMNHF